MGSQRAYVSMDNLSVGYNGKAVLEHINVDIEKGEIVTLIGPNGAGKSTILKSITRQLKLIDGCVVLDGSDITALSFKELSSRMAVVLTERMKPELMTCHDIVATGRYPYTGKLGLLTREDERIVDAAMAAVHATEIGGRDFDAISDGQRQRVLLARAICQEPDVMVLDEPTSFLDVRHKLDLLSILRGMAKENGITVIMSLHEIDLAMKVSDKIMCVKGTSVMRYGDPDDIFEDGLIQELYDIEAGSFDTTFGSIELPGVMGTPRVLVLSNCGTGIPVYRRLQKQGIAFAAAILSDNDVDYQLARLLAADVVTTPAFEDPSESALERTLAYVESCERVIDAGLVIGSHNRRLQEVLDAARAAGKLEEVRLCPSSNAM